MEIIEVVKFMMAVGVFATLSAPTEAFPRNISDPCADYLDSKTTICTLYEGGGWGFSCREGHEFPSAAAEYCVPMQSSDDGTPDSPCMTSNDCLSSLQCKHDRCIDPCMHVDSYDHATCKVELHRLKWECDPGYEHPTFSDEICIPDMTGRCFDSFQCDSTELCIRGICRNPCLSLSDHYATCIVRDHRMEFECHFGYKKMLYFNACVPVGS